MANMEVNQKKDDHLQPVFFAVGAAVLAACLQRAAVEQWRVWVFLTLNLLLLAVLFTSYSGATPASSRSEDQEGMRDADQQQPDGDQRENRRKQCKSSDEDGGSSLKLCKSSQSCRDDEREVVESEGDMGATLMSDEELNERVEAFIAMFRQQLISDAKKKNKLNSQSSAA